MATLDRHAGQHRRQFLKLTGFGAAGSWLTPLGTLLAREAEAAPRGSLPQSVIMLWMEGGPSQLETWDPHPDQSIAYGTKSIRTSQAGVQIAQGLEQTAEWLHEMTLVRSVVSLEGDHERGTYTVKTGFRPDPTVIHPALGAVLCKHLPRGGVDIPRHISILPGNWPTRGGYLGDEFNAFRLDDPAGPPPDLTSFASEARDQARIAGLDVIEGEFQRGRRAAVQGTRHRETIAEARTMMSSEQIRAFDVTREPLKLRQAYGDTAFGRGCLAARRLIEVGVRCVEVTLSGWDTHVNNHAFCTTQKQTLDPALAALLRDLKERGLWEKTMVVVAGEFGRTPILNPAGGRDHWPNGFSIALAGGAFRSGYVHGATDPEGGRKPKDPVRIGDIHATILAACGIDPAKIHSTAIGRTVPTADGVVVPQLLRHPEAARFTPPKA